MEKKKEQNCDVSIIIPVHELNDITKGLFANAIKSIETQIIKPNEVLIIVPTKSEVKTFMENFDFNSIKDITRIVENNGDTDFCTQFNLGVNESKSKWVSLLEYDDEMSSIWLKNVVKYEKAYPEVELFLPIIVDVNSTNEFLSFTNEAVWANSFSDELGMLDNSALLTYQNFNIDGMVISKEIYEANGGFKKNIKLTFIYEFLLRMTFKDVKTMVIPKFGYKHINQREGSLFSSYKEEMDPTESNWWLAQAKKEYYFEKDRAITYQN
jgi:hypothetical protein